MPGSSIGVVGAGVIGLSTALNLQQRLPSARVTIYADKFEQDTTSHGAGGLFRPNTDHCLGIDAETITRWSVDGFRHFSNLAKSTDSRDTGHMIMPGYVFSHKPLEDPLYKRIVYSFKELQPSELRELGVDYKYGYQVTTIITDCSRYMPWLMRKFQEAGGLVVKKQVESLEEFVGVHDVVVNCSGLRSRELVGDKSVYPVRGHLLRLQAPWVKYWVYTEDDTYFIPSFDNVAVGGIRQKDNYSRTIDPKDREGILQRCYKLWPSLQSAPIEREWVDLRPHRDPVRVERETMHFNKGPLQVVHNYGHGAVGITLSWGSSIDAAALTVQAINEQTAKL